MRWLALSFTLLGYTLIYAAAANGGVFTKDPLLGMMGDAYTVGAQNASYAGASSTEDVSNSTNGATVSGSVTKNQLTTIAASHGWDSQQVAYWELVIQRESGGNPNAMNTSSGAAGIAQFINGYSEYAQYGGDASTVTGQLTAMANYIAERYGTPQQAWAHELSAGWY